MAMESFNATSFTCSGVFVVASFCLQNEGIQVSDAACRTRGNGANANEITHAVWKPGPME